MDLFPTVMFNPFFRLCIFGLHKVLCNVMVHVTLSLFNQHSLIKSPLLLIFFACAVAGFISLSCTPSIPFQTAFYASFREAVSCPSILSNAVMLAACRKQF